MADPMDESVKGKLEEQELLVDLPAGGVGVRVSLQFQSAVVGPSREQRRHELENCFHGLAEQFPDDICSMEMDSLSVSGQTVEAVIPYDRFEQVEKKLLRNHVRVDILAERQVTEF